jgi:hypothetical protein
MSYSHAEEHLIYQILNAPVRDYPFPHAFIENVFPNDYYQDMLINLPPISGYLPIHDTGNVSGAKAQGLLYSSRYITDVSDLAKRGVPEHLVSFWNELSNSLLSERFLRTILFKFSAAYKERFSNPFNSQFKLSSELRLVRDFEDYSIGPHTDTPKKVVSLLFYLPKDWEYEKLGTSIYIPKDPSVTCIGGPHYGFKGYKRIFTAPFIPNSMLMFFKTPKSFHGVEKITDKAVERNVMLYNIYCDPVPELLKGEKIHGHSVM